MFSNGKIKVKTIEAICIVLGFCFFFAALLLVLGYQFFEYRFNKILLTYLTVYTIVSLTLLLLVAFCDVKKIKFYKVFLFIIIFVWIFISLYFYIIDNNIKNIFLIIIDTSVLASGAIIFINNLITRVFFWEGDNKNSQDVDALSSEFAVDVLSIALFLGIILGLFGYLFFVPNQTTPSFFGSIDIKTVAIATAGLVTFFWAAKAAKNKSIELEEKKQDGKRRDKEIKMAEARDTAQLIAKASELLGSENDAQKNAGLAFLNTVASQKGGPLQKEAFDLLADFILSASDTTTSNKPRMRAITYINNQIETNCHEFRIYKFIKISITNNTGYFSIWNNIDLLIFQSLKIIYIGFTVDYQFIDNINELKINNKIIFIDCRFRGNRKNGNIVEISGIDIVNSTIEYCKIDVMPNIFPMMFYDELVSERKNKNICNKFESCDFSDCENWKYNRISVPVGQEKDIFNRCFYYTGHAPYGFNEKFDGALLTEIVSEQQFNKLMDNPNYGGYLPRFIEYSPPDDKTSNE